MENKEDLWLEIIKQMRQRREIGLEQYKVPVTATSSVDWFKHAEEEQLDNLVYLRAAKAVYNKLLQAARVLLDKSPESVKLMDEHYRNPDSKNEVAAAWMELWNCVTDDLPYYPETAL